MDSDSGTLFTTRGAAAAVNFTKPATAKKGLSYKFFNIADFEMMVTSGTADTLIVFNDATADTVAYTTAAEHIGGSFEVIGDGTGWMVIASAHSQGTASQTITVAT